MIKNYRILVDGQLYTGEKEVELNTWKADPWSKDSFHTQSSYRNVLTFEPKENNHFKTIVGATNLAGEIKRIIDFIRSTELMAGDEIIIESSPYKIPLELNIDYFLDIESELSKQKTINQEMKEQLDIATDLGQQRFEKIVELEKENKILFHDKETLMLYGMGQQQFRLSVLSLVSEHYKKHNNLCPNCGGRIELLK